MESRTFVHPNPGRISVARPVSTPTAPEPQPPHAPPGDARFDKVFGVHFPPLLRGQPGRELAVVRGCLAPGGTLHVIFQPFTAVEVDGSVEQVAARLDANGFRVDRVGRRAATPAPVVSVAARPTD